jgi:hypothetical protein
MLENFRKFKAGPDPFGRIWDIEFRWLQTGISIRHADTVDVKFEAAVEGEPKYERVVALPHPDLLKLSRETGHALTDAWCLKIAALHLKHMIETGGDIEKTLVSLPLEQMREYAKVSTHSHVG